MFNLFVVSAMFIVYLEWNNTLFRALIVKPIAQVLTNRPLETLLGGN